MTSSTPFACKLFGSLTSPYVRRVRALAVELGLPVQFVDTTSAAGQAELRTMNPLWKIPAADINGELYLDSASILNALSGHAEAVAFDANSLKPDQRAALQVLDGAMDALINTMYLAREGAQPEQYPYLAKQKARARSSMLWLEHRATLFSKQDFGVLELGLCTALGWMEFRNAFPLQDTPQLQALHHAHASRQSMLSTKPS